MNRAYRFKLLSTLYPLLELSTDRLTQAPPDMNFFEQQDRSRRTTRTLVGLFTASVMFTGICVYFAVMLTINTTFLKSMVFGERGCQPVVPVSATVQPRNINAQTSIPLLPSATDGNYQLKGGRSSGFSRFGSSPTRSFGDNNRSYSNRTTYYHSTDRNSLSSTNPNCRIPTIWWDFRVFFWTLISTAMLMGLPSWWKINQLQAGGAVIAAELGGIRVFPETATAAEQQLLNIVEEMAIAATMAVPPVYLLADELGINAFAAGLTINDAVIGVTQGSLEQLNRDELQGVIAHEFSHILNGDMAMNIRLMGMLHGILGLHLVGRVLSYTGSSRDNPLFTLGILLRIIGFSGFISGRLIQSAISRQREFLADASAVQFTRNADGIGSALAKIGGLSSQIDSPHAETTSHMFFSPALNFSWLEGLFATHPPLAQRIQIVRGAGKKLGTKIVVNGQAVPIFNQITRLETSNFITTGLASLDDEMAETTPGSSAVGEYGVLAYLYALLLDRSRSSEQLAYLAQLEEPAIIEQIESLKSAVNIIPPQQRLASLDRYVAKIRDTAHAPRLLKCAYGMVEVLPPEDWHTAIVYLILHHRLAPTATPQVTYHSIDDVWAEIINILGTLARLTSDRPQDISYSFEASLLRLPTSHTSQAKLPPEITWREFQTDLSKIAAATLKVKQTLITACLEILTNQRQIPIDGADLMRSIAIRLDCPIPPLLDKSPSSQRAMR
jgi:Zn-dependent protease with chaperone function